MEGHVFIHPPCLESSDPRVFDCGLMTSSVPLPSGQDSQRNQRQKWNQEGYKATRCHPPWDSLEQHKTSREEWQQLLCRHRVGYPSHQEREGRRREKWKRNRDTWEESIERGKKARSREPTFAGLYLAPYPECLSWGPTFPQWLQYAPYHSMCPQTLPHEHSSVIEQPEYIPVILRQHACQSIGLDLH